MENKGVTRGGFALLTKVAAALVAAGTFVVLRLPEPPARLIIVAAPAAPASWLEQNVTDSRLAALPALRDTGIIGAVQGMPASSSAARFWRDLFADAAAAGVDSDGRAMWERLRGRVAAIAVPARIFDGEAIERATVAATQASAFTGTSAGAVVAMRDLAADRLPASYQDAAPAIAAAAEKLAQDRWSAWIPLEDGRAQMQLTRISDTDLWLSPIYNVFRVPTTPPTTAILGDPFLRGVDADLRRVMLTHLAEVERTRTTAAQRVLSTSGETRAVVLFHTLAASLNAMSAPEPPAGGNVATAREELDRTLAALRDAAPGPSTVLLVGGPGLTREPAGEVWYLLSDGRGTAARADLDVGQLRGVLRHLLGIPLDADERRSVPAAVLARFPVRGVSVASAPESPPSQEIPWDVRSLESIGAGAGAAVVSEAAD